MQYVKLFTMQNAKTLHQLKRDGRFINNRMHVQLHLGDIAPYFIKKYDWLTRQAARRLPKPEDVHAPIWCAISPRSCMSPDQNSLVYCLEVPCDQILFFDNLKWDYVLNQLYIPRDEEDEKAYRKHLSDLGIPSRYDLSKDRYRNQFPEEIKRIEASWERIFDLEEWGIWNVCANIWEVREEWVRKIIYYGEEADMEELERCDEGVVLFDTWPDNFKQLPPHLDIEENDTEESGMVSVREMRQRFVVK